MLTNLLKVKERMERAQQLPLHRRLQQRGELRGEPVGKKGLRVTKSYESDHFIFWHIDWPTTKVYVSKMAIYDASPMVKLEAHYIQARAEMLSTLYWNVQKTRKAIGLPLLEFEDTRIEEYNSDKLTNRDLIAQLTGITF